MNSFLQIPRLQLLIFCMDDQEFATNLICYVFFCNLIKVNHFLCCFVLLFCFVALFLARSLLVPYAYVSIESIDCILLSSFELKAILLISFVKTLCFSLLNLRCVFNTNLKTIYLETIYVIFISF